ncbi:helix-turn-helix domain-containing protein [Reichenbachiella versicolor]|uniref:helix-turn-helix domain-containing protein n=1 Tax=Reichenbachiella versicolor TaxID=1821036 RepID=UPI000D6E8776|nr:AraC family transcriptional regulator [Reichenbachiella versicolor]
MKTYHLHKNDSSKLHFELKETKPYFFVNEDKASKPHRHTFFQILWFKEEGRHYIDYEVIDHPANSVFLVNQNQVHYFCPESSNEGYLFHFNDSFISKLSMDLLFRFSVSIFSEIGQPFIHLTEGQVEKVGSITDSIMSELDDQEENFENIVMHQFLNLLFELERIKKKQTTYTIDSNSDFSIIVKFKQLIIENISQNLSIQDYSKQLGVSAKRLTSLTKQYTSLTPANQIKELKVLEAKRKLSNKNISIKEVAYSLGFDQPTYFTKFFKKETSTTPKQFQEQLL